MLFYFLTVDLFSLAFPSNFGVLPKTFTLLGLSANFKGATLFVSTLFLFLTVVRF